ncbi:putative amino acid permease YhdG [compost metagenome]
MTVFTAIVVAILAGIMRLDELASLANAGTLMAFMAVGVSLIVLRVREPNRERKFKAPLWWLVGGIAIVGCITFFFSLKSSTQFSFLLWNLFGLAVYLVWSSRNSRLAKGQEAEG